MALLTVHKKWLTHHLAGQSIIINKNIEIYVVYLSINLAKSYDIILINLNQSNGGIGIILNTANMIFIIENLIQNIINQLYWFKNISLIHIQNIFAEINNSNTPHVASAIFMAGPAKATINSHFTGSL